MIDLNNLDIIGVWVIEPDGIIGGPAYFRSYFIPNDMIFATREVKDHLVWEWPIFIAEMVWSTERDVVDLLLAMVIKMSSLNAPTHLEEMKYQIHWKTICCMIDIVESKHGNVA